MPLALRRVGTKTESRRWNIYIQRHHYLGHKLLPGAQLRHLVYCAEQPIALLGFGAAAWMSAPRDRYIGWTHEQRKRNLHLIVNSARFLILPWIQSKNLASMLLAKAAKMLPHHWQEVYGYNPVLLEPLLRNHASGAPATRPPIGSIWDKPKAEQSSVPPANRVCRSKTYVFPTWIGACERRLLPELFADGHAEYLPNLFYGCFFAHYSLHKIAI
jgi:hypothetical protein